MYFEATVKISPLLTGSKVVKCEEKLQGKSNLSMHLFMLVYDLRPKGAWLNPNVGVEPSTLPASQSQASVYLPVYVYFLLSLIIRRCAKY